MIRIPMPEKSSYSPQPLPEPEFKSAIQGLTVLAPQLEAKELSYQAAADVTRDLQAWKAATAAWEEEYCATRTGADARNAVEEARAFNEAQFKPLQEKYANDPNRAKYLHDDGSSICNRSSGRMLSYSRMENERFVDSVLAEEEKDMRAVMASPWSDYSDKKKAFDAYAFKAENWRLSRGETPEEIQAWKKDMRVSVASEALQARFERVLEQNPREVLDLFKAETEKETSDFNHYLAPEQLRLLHNRAEAAQQNRRRLDEEQAGVIQTDMDAALLRAVDGEDLSPLRDLEDELSYLGKPEEARQATATREALSLAQPYLTASQFEPFEQQSAGLKKFFAKGEAASGEDGASNGETALGETHAASGATAKALSIAERGLAERKNRFLRDPAGYAEGHPLLSQEGLSGEDRFTRSLTLQARLGQGLDTSPRLLPETRAAAIKDEYEGLAEPAEKAQLARDLCKDGGKYATRLLAEAELPPGVSAFAQVLPDMPMSEATKLTQAAATSLDDLNIPEARKEAIKKQVENSPLAQSLRLVSDALAELDPASNDAADETIQTLESFVALGGSLSGMVRRVALANASLSQNEEAMQPWLRGLSLGMRDVVEGMVGLADIPATLVRTPMNGINAALGGDPNLFKPVAPLLGDKLGFATPETPREKLQSSIQQGLIQLPLFWWGGSTMVAQKSATAVPTLTQATGQMLAGTPKADVAGTVGAAVAGAAAQQAGAGPVGTIAAEMLGSLTPGGKGGGKVTSGGAGSRGAKVVDNVDDAAEAAARAEVKAAGPAAQANAAVSQVKPKGKDFKDLRTEAEIQASHERLKSFKPKPENFLYAPYKETAAISMSHMDKLARNLKKDLEVVATPVEVSPGQWRLRVDHVPPQPQLPELQSTLQDAYSAMLRGEQRKVPLWIIGPEEAARIADRTGVDVLLNKRILDTDQIAHAFSRHGNELTPGQLPITEQDFIRYGEILLDPHSIERGTSPKSIVYSRRYPDGTVYALEQQKQGSKLEFRTLWKQEVGGVMVPILSVGLPTGEED